LKNVEIEVVHAGKEVGALRTLRLQIATKQFKRVKNSTKWCKIAPHDKKQSTKQYRAVKKQYKKVQNSSKQ
jgi:hypothetical protein